jgi:cyclic-di-GMP phosphodiesterase TipF (flagellum assembly factor)
LRPEGASATGGAPSNRGDDSAAQDSQGSNGFGKTANVEAAAVDLPARTSGNAALARRLAGPG